MEYKEFSPESLMMSYGYDASEHQGSIKCPLYQTSTFEFKSAEEGKAFFEIAYGIREKRPDEKLGMIYSRLNNPTLDLAEKRLAAYEGADEALFFSSGMGAISTTVFTFLKPGDILLYASPVYGGTEHLFHNALPAFNIGIVKFYAGETQETIMERVSKEFPGKKPKVIYIEVPGNPTNSLIDIAMCARMAEHYKEGDCKPLLVVDNTFLGPVFQHPLKHGADISLYSATKFIGGHSDLVGGACVGHTQAVSEIRVMRSFLGSQMDPHSAWLVLRSLETLKIRMEQQAFGAAKVAKYLEKHPKIEKVSYLGLLKEGEQGKEIYDRQCLSSGSMISFYIKGGEKEAYNFLNNIHLFKLAVSLGSTESLAEHPATMTHIDVQEDEKKILGINEQLVRLSIGLENPDDLIKAIDAVKNWVVYFKRGDFSTCDAPRPGRPKTVTTPEIIDQIHEIILKDNRISANSIAEQLGISRERFGSIIHEDLDMRKLSAKWVPKCLNMDQKRQRCQSSEQIWNFFGAIQMISCGN